MALFPPGTSPHVVELGHFQSPPRKIVKTAHCGKRPLSMARLVKKHLDNIECVDLPLSIKLKELNSLTHLASTAGVEKLVFIKEGAIPILLHLMQSLSNNVSIQVHCCAVLHNLLPDTALCESNVLAQEVQDEIFRYGGILSLINAVGVICDYNRRNNSKKTPDTSEDVVQRLLLSCAIFGPTKTYNAADFSSACPQNFNSAEHPSVTDVRTSHGHNNIEKINLKSRKSMINENDKKRRSKVDNNVSMKQLILPSLMNGTAEIVKSSDNLALGFRHSQICSSDESEENPSLSNLTMDLERSSQISNLIVTKVNGHLNAFQFREYLQQLSIASLRHCASISSNLLNTSVNIMLSKDRENEPGLESLLFTFSKNIVQLMNVDCCTIWVAENNKKFLEFSCSNGKSLKARTGPQFAAHLMNSDRTVEYLYVEGAKWNSEWNGKDWVPPDPDDDDFTYSPPFCHATNVLCVPVYAKSGNIIAVVQVSDKLSSNITERYFIGKDVVAKSSGAARRVAAAISRDDHYIYKNLPELDIQSRIIHFGSEDALMLRVLSAKLANMMIQDYQAKQIKDSENKFNVIMTTTENLATELELDKLIQESLEIFSIMIIQAARELLQCDQCTLFLLDTEKKELWSKIKSARGFSEIRIPMDKGIAGYVCMTNEVLNIPNAYKDSRFNRDVDLKTGYRTRNILCIPLINNRDKTTIGVTQMINKHSGPFNVDDIRLLRAFSSQAAIAIQKARLLRNSIEMRNYLESVLQSISSVVVTLSDKGHLVTVNRPMFSQVLGVSEDTMRSSHFSNWLLYNDAFLSDIMRVISTEEPVFVPDYQLEGPGGTKTINYSIVPLKDYSDSSKATAVYSASKERRDSNSTASYRSNLSTPQSASGTRSDDDKADMSSSDMGIVIVMEDISHEKKMMSTLGRYMSPALVKQVMGDGAQCKLGGTRQKVSVLFSDIRSFTQLSEAMEPTEIVDMLNEHFAQQEAAITAENGILDKYIGDAVMAVFGVPFSAEGDSIRACNCAIRMRDNLKSYNAQRISAGKNIISMGIGINTGPVLSGNIGSVKRMEYTVIGDNVNLASRIEGVTKQYGVQILISEYTKSEIATKFVTREIDRLRVVGKKQPIQIFELVGDLNYDYSDDFLSTLKRYKKGLDEYRKRHWKLALMNFSAAAEDGDKPSEIMAERCRALINGQTPNVPKAGWDGVWQTSSK